MNRDFSTLRAALEKTPSFRIITDMATFAYRYRLYPTRTQEAKLSGWLESLRLVYNFALAERREAYKTEKRSLCVYEQKRALPDLKKRFSRYTGINSQVLQDTLFRLDRAFRRFFAGGGHPRFKGEDRYRSFTYPQATAFRISGKGNKIRLSSIGHVRSRYHRPLEGTPKTATVTRYPSGRWYVCISCRVPDVPAREDASLTGFDLGLTNFLTSSDGMITRPLRSLKRAERRLQREQRRLSRKKKGSENRRRQRIKVARAHEKVANRRRDFLHKTSRSVVDSHEGFAFEKLHVKSMLKNHRLAKAISEAGWATFVSMTAYKAARAGKPFVLVDPRNTSNLCSGCDTIVSKALANRTHACPECGLTLDRDYNAAINVKRRAGTVRSYACGEAATVGGASRPQVASKKQEAPSFTAV
jgi:putative transposase